VTTHTLSVIVENKPGVLARIAGLFARRGYNIDSLAVGPTDDPDLSRLTIEVGDATPVVLEQIVKQLHKLIEVLKISELEEDQAVRRELILVKVTAEPAVRGQIIEVVQLFRAKTVDAHNDSMIIEATGSPEKLAALMAMLAPYGVRELVRSGLVALGRGSRSMTGRGKIAKDRRTTQLD